MPTFALIQNGAVTNIAAADADWPGFAGQTWVRTDTLSPQPGIGWAATETDGTWSFTPPPPPPPPTPTPASAYAAFIAAGAAVTSTGTPALNGTYGISATDQAKITSVASFVATYSEFPNGATSNMAWVLANGSAVEFPTTASFLAFAKAIGQLVYSADIALASGLTTMPSNAMTIA